MILTMLELQIIAAIQTLLVKTGAAPYAASVMRHLNGLRLGSVHKHGTVHAVMMQLEKKGFLTLTSESPNSPKRGERTRKVARITAAGEDAKRKTWEAMQRIMETGE